MSRLIGVNVETMTPDEVTQLCWLRAVEWLGWPSFISQPLLPLLYVSYPVYWVLVAVACVGIVWLPFRYEFASLQLATLAALWVRLKWITIPIGVYFLFEQHRYVAIVITLLTPWLVSFLNFPAVVFAVLARSPSEVGTVQQKFLRHIEATYRSQFTSVG